MWIKIKVNSRWFMADRENLMKWHTSQKARVDIYAGPGKSL